MRLTALLGALALTLACKRAPRRPPSPTSPTRAPPPAALVAEGRRLVDRYECARCHELSEVPRPTLFQDCLGCHRAVHAGTFPARPEHRDAWRASVVDLVDAPSLARLGARLEPRWIEAFLQHPTDVRPGLRATMPRLAIGDSEARALTAFLTRDDVSAPSLGTPDRSLVERGRTLFRDRSCGTCHAFRDARSPTPAPAESDTTRLAPDLSLTRDRFRVERVATWIRAPSRIKPDTAMPALATSDEEALALASYVWFAPLAPEPVRPAPPMLPALTRRVAWPEVEAAVFHRTCRHCHADASLAFGDGGPGNTGGFGFAPRRLELATYPGTMSGMLVDGERRSAFEVDASGMPRLVHALRARQLEEVGTVEEGVRGMPLGHPALTPETLQLVTSWIASGRPVE